MFRMSAREFDQKVWAVGRFAALILTGVLLAGGLSATGVWSNLAAAKEETKDLSMRPWFASQLTKAHEATAKKNYQQALDVLKNARRRGKMSRHETAMVHQTEGYVFHSQSKYKMAAVAFEKTLATRMVPEQAMKELHYNLAGIYQMEKRYKKSLVHFLRWFSKEEKPTGSDCYTIA